MKKLYSNKYLKALRSPAAVALYVLAACSEYEVKKLSGGFSGEVQNIVQNNCVQCHAGGQSEGGFGNIDSPASIIETGRIIPGDAENSLLYQKITNPPYGSKMPFGGPYLSSGQVKSVGDWINSYRKQWNVVASATAGITLSTASVTVENGDTTSFTLTVQNGYNLSTTVGGSCPTGSWQDLTYTTGAIVNACSVEFSASNPNAINLTLGENNSTSVSVTPTYAGERKTLYPTASVNLPSHANGAPTPSYSISTTVGGTCAQGEWSGSSYITGPLTTSCTVTFTVNNPCGTSHNAGIDDVYSSVRLKALGGESLKQNAASGSCIGCHRSQADPATNPVVTQGMYCVNTNGAGCNQTTQTARYTEYARIINPYCNTAGGDTTFPCNSTNGQSSPNAGGVVAKDPLNSWIYRILTAAHPGPNRMPRQTENCTKTTETECLQQARIDAVCNWIWKGAADN